MPSGTIARDLRSNRIEKEIIDENVSLLLQLTYQIKAYHGGNARTYLELTD